MRPKRLAWACAAAALALTAARAGAQSLPLEEKAKFEHAMQERAESVLLRILGPNRYKVVVDAALDFTRIEKFDVKGGVAVGADKSALYLWQSVGAEASGRSQLLPGIPSPEPVPDLGGTKSYQRENAFPAEFVKRMTVTVILDQTVPVELGDQISKIVQDVLDTRPDRGDVLTIVRAPFAPAWKTIWHTPESASLLFKYGIIALMTLITLIVVAACFLKLAEAMDAMAQAQSTQMSLDAGEGKGSEEEEESKKKKEAEAAATAAEEAGKVYFEVKAGQVDTLWEILHRQDPENIALVVAHLRPEVKRAFLSRLPPSFYSQILMCMGTIKFIEADTVAAVKEELERRLESAVGGHGKLLELIEDSDLKAKKALLRLLESRDRKLADVVRSRILLFEDLNQLEPREWSIVLSQIQLDDWGAALHEAEQRLCQALEKQMLPKTWAILTQMREIYAPTEEQADAAREKVMRVVGSLMKDGRIGNLINRRPAAPIAVEPEPAPVFAGEPPVFEEEPPQA